MTKTCEADSYALLTTSDNNKVRTKKDPKEQPHKQKVCCLHLFCTSISPENPQYQKAGIQISLWCPTEHHDGMQTIKKILVCSLRKDVTLMYIPETVLQSCTEMTENGATTSNAQTEIMEVC
jgi:hypothetical protein